MARACIDVLQRPWTGGTLPSHLIKAEEAAVKHRHLIFSVGFLISSWNGSLSMHIAQICPMCTTKQLAPWVLEFPNSYLCQTPAQSSPSGSAVSQEIVPRLHPTTDWPRKTFWIHSSALPPPLAPGLSCSGRARDQVNTGREKHSAPSMYTQGCALLSVASTPALLFSPESPRVHTDHPRHRHGWGWLQHHGYGHSGNP